MTHIRMRQIKESVASDNLFLTLVPSGRYKDPLKTILDYEKKIYLNITDDADGYRPVGGVYLM